MPIDVQLVGSRQSGAQRARVSADGYQEVEVRVGSPPDIGSRSRLRHFSRLLDSEGDGTGDTNMGVDGSSSSQTFIASASPQYDTRLTGFVITIEDGAVAHDKFGDIAALANGWDLRLEEDGSATTLIDAAKTGGQVIAQTALTGAFGSGSTSHQLTDLDGTNDALLVFFPIGALIPAGIRLGRATHDRVVSVISDDLSDLANFTVRAMGYSHYPHLLDDIAIEEAVAANNMLFRAAVATFMTGAFPFVDNPSDTP